MTSYLPAMPSKYPTTDPAKQPLCVVISHRPNGWRVKRSDRSRATAIRLTRRKAIALATRIARTTGAQILLCDAVGYSTRLAV